MTDRRYYRPDDERQHSGYDRWGNRQQEQFEQRGYRGSGQAGDRYRRDQSTQMGQDYYGDYSPDSYSQTNDYQQREYGADRDTWRGTARAQRGTFGSFAGDYGRDPREFGSFTGSDFGGRDFSVPKRNRDYTGSSGGYGAYGGYTGSGYGSGSYDRGTSNAGSPYEREDRGFFDRAGDEIASWFGDEDAARRREADHSGYGPTNYTRSDERILEDSCDRLTRDWAVDARNVQVTVQNGEVTLDGTVPSRSQKRRAEDCVDDVSGVSNVQNNLRVQAGSQQSAQGTDAL